MNYFKTRFLIVVTLALFGGVLLSCSGEDTIPVPPEPPVLPPPSVPPPPPLIELTQLDVLLSEPTLVSRAANPEGANAMKTAFAAGDFFTFTYPITQAQEYVTYAHTTDGKSWVFRRTAEITSNIEKVHFATENVGVKATYLPLAAAGALDGIVLGVDNMLTCYDALRASAEAKIAGEKASVSLVFTHVNHLLRFSLGGDASVADVDHLRLTVSYTDAAGQPQTSVLKTTLHTEYTEQGGAKTPVVQAIVPREAVLKGITVVLSSGTLLVVNDPDHSPVDLACPGGKSRLIPLTVKGDKLTMQPGDISAGWADGGIINSNDKLADAIYISSAADLKKFRDAVNRDPATDLAKINGVLAYTANVVQTANIDLSAENWTPIGGVEYNADGGDMTYFAGTYNGNGYTISNMQVTQPLGNGVSHYGGLFGWVKSPNDRNAVLVGIHLRNASINFNLSSNYTLYLGALVGRIDGNTNYPTVVSLCSATGSITTNSPDQIDMGGLVGSAEKAHITRCTVNVPTTATGNAKTSVAGVVGNMRNSYTVSCYARGNVKIVANGANTRAYAGGIVGNVDDAAGVPSLIMSCRADGNVDAAGQEVYAGGLVGAGIGTLQGSFAKGSVTGTASGTGKVGAIVGDFPGTKSLCWGTSPNGQGSSNAVSEGGNIIYESNPGDCQIITLMGNFGQATGVLTVVNPFSSGAYSTRVESRLWVVSPSWDNTASGGDSKYPAPVMSYAGLQL